uniref:Bor family protein n=1 Tax=Roseihalotalea indica TaxID=2867963 RepID=A0AA49GKV8_9BACT|nr:Bor family protein [Tunicatimonas sp. TK19036]
MKKMFLNLGLALGISLMMSSCYTYSYSVGEGSQSGVAVKQMNHYLVYGLAPLDTSIPAEMAGGAKDYDVTITHTFVDGLINAVTFGIYSPTTTIVTK